MSFDFPFGRLFGVSVILLLPLFTSCLPMVGGTPTSSTTKTGRHNIAEKLPKVALKKLINQSYILIEICCTVLSNKI